MLFRSPGGADLVDEGTGDGVGVIVGVIDGDGVIDDTIDGDGTGRIAGDSGGFVTTSPLDHSNLTIGRGEMGFLYTAGALWGAS